MLVSGNIAVNFTAASNVSHRICYRIGSSGPYTCINTSICGIGACSGSIPIFVDNDTCTVIQFEGYVQAGCQDINSTTDRVPFSATFTPTPGCQLYTLTCSNVPISSTVTITNNGSGGYFGATPTAIFTGGGGSGAAGTVNVGIGKLKSGTAVITTAGSGYINGTYTNVGITGGSGSGSGALATVIVSGGAVTSITLTTFGSGYIYAENSLGLNPVNLGGASPSVSAQFQAMSDKGNINSITVTNQGSGYTSVPTITISSFDGHQATATAALSPCSSFTNNGCLGSPVVIPQGPLTVGQTISVCSSTGVVTPGSNFAVSLSGNCLCNCVRATIAAVPAADPSQTQIRYFYTRCNNVVVTGILTVGSSPAAIIDCIVPNSVIFQPIGTGVTGSVTLGGAC